MQQALVWVLNHFGLQFGYNLTHIWHIWYILVRPDARNAAYRYHRRRGRSRIQAALDVYHSFYRMGKMLIDRFAVYSGYQFDIVVENKEHYYDKTSNPEGFVLMFSHVGNSEIGAYTMRTPDKHMNVLAFGGESPVVMEHRKRVLEKNNIGMIEVHAGSVEHIYAISEALNRGEVLAVAGDRCWGEKTIECEVLGAPAPLPAGVFQLCVAMRCPIVLPFVFKESLNRYHIYTEELSVNTSLPRNKQAQDLAQRFADKLTYHVQAHPYDWFNFFPFWSDEKK